MKINFQIQIPKEQRIYCNYCKTLLADYKSGEKLFCYPCGKDKGMI